MLRPRHLGDATHWNEQLVRLRYDAFNRGDLAAAMDIFAEGMVWVVPGDNRISGTYHGPQEIAAHFANMMAIAAGQFQLDAYSFVADDDRVVALVRVTIVRQGRSWVYDAAQVWQLVEGRAVRFQEYLADQVVVDAIFA